MFKQLNNYHPSFNNFLNEEIKNELEYIYNQIKDQNCCPELDSILSFLAFDLRKLKIVIIGQDPYYNLYKQQKAATGRAFEINNLYLNESFRQSSLKNLIRVIFKLKYNQLYNYNELKIKERNFFNQSNKAYFDFLENQGVLFLNVSLSCEFMKPLSHQKLWWNFSMKLLKYLDELKPIFLLMGTSAKTYQKYLKSKCYTSNHPMILNTQNENDLSKSNFFSDTAKVIKWLS